MTNQSRRLPLGIGIYDRAEAARLIGVTPSRLRRWVSGYTYQYEYRETSARRARPPVVHLDLPVLDDSIALSFVELMELRVVRALRERKVSLQEIRRAASVAAEYFGTEHPFASCRVYASSRKVFAATNPGGGSSDFVELSRARVGQFIAGGILEPFLEEIDFDDETSLAARWWPLGKDVPIVLDPQIAFGAPTVQGTRLRTSFIVDMSRSSTAEELARSYGLEIRGIEAALHFEQHLKAA